MTVRYIYVAGPMTGVSDYNFPAFDEAEIRLFNLGWAVQNPTINGSSTDKPYEYYIRHALNQVLLCDAIALLPGWRNSTGAQTELYVAVRCGMGVYEYYAYARDAEDPLVKRQAWINSPGTVAVAT